MHIMEQYIQDIAATIGRCDILIELGSGNSQKTRLLLDHVRGIEKYVPVDISHDVLLESAEKTALFYPNLEVCPVWGDYMQELKLPVSCSSFTRKCVYFPGSTIGNLELFQVLKFLSTIFKLCAHNGALLVGVDLKKDVRTLEAAYNDCGGVTARFNLNILRRLNQSLGANFDLSQFRHRAVYNNDQNRIEMYLVSLKKQYVYVGENEFCFDKNEAICTEYSYKYMDDQLECLAKQVGFKVCQSWFDDRKWFGVYSLE